MSTSDWTSFWEVPRNEIYVFLSVFFLMLDTAGSKSCWKVTPAASQVLQREEGGELLLSPCYRDSESTNPSCSELADGQVSISQIRDQTWTGCNPQQGGLWLQGQEPSLPSVGQHFLRDVPSSLHPSNQNPHIAPSLKSQ